MDSQLGTINSGHIYIKLMNIAVSNWKHVLHDRIVPFPGIK